MLRLSITLLLSLSLIAEVLGQPCVLPIEMTTEVIMHRDIDMTVEDRYYQQARDTANPIRIFHTRKLPNGNQVAQDGFDCQPGAYWQNSIFKHQLQKVTGSVTGGETDFRCAAVYFRSHSTLNWWSYGNGDIQTCDPYERQINYARCFVTKNLNAVAARVHDFPKGFYHVRYQLPDGVGGAIDYCISAPNSLAAIYDHHFDFSGSCSTINTYEQPYKSILEIVDSDDMNSNAYVGGTPRLAILRYTGSGEYYYYCARYNIAANGEIEISFSVEHKMMCKCEHDKTYNTLEANYVRFILTPTGNDWPQSYQTSINGEWFQKYFPGTNNPYIIEYDGNKQTTYPVLSPSQKTVFQVLDEHTVASSVDNPLAHVVGNIDDLANQYCMVSLAHTDVIYSRMILTSSQSYDAQQCQGLLSPTNEALLVNPRYDIATPSTSLPTCQSFMGEFQVRVILQSGQTWLCTDDPTSTATGDGQSVDFSACHQGSLTYESPQIRHLTCLDELAAFPDFTPQNGKIVIFMYVEPGGTNVYYCARYQEIGSTIQMSFDTRNKLEPKCDKDQKYDTSGSFGQFVRLELAHHCDRTTWPTCQNGGTCIRTSGGYECACTQDYTGVHCENPIPCQPNPCQNGGICTQPGGITFQCTCLGGYIGTRCQFDLCDGDYCQNGGECTHTANGVVCNCLANYIGDHCQHNHPCIPNPCQYGGTCLPQGGIDFICSCPVGYSGIICHIPTLCNPNPCLNGGTCLPITGDTYICQCRPGYVGDYCQIDSCNPNPCLNGGICTPEGVGVACDCPQGYSGDRCQTSQPCVPNPCQHGGTCSPQTGGVGFECDCTQYYTGFLCHIPILCDPDPCLNGGTCLPITGGTYICQCRPGYVGNHCQIASCNPNPCLNGGICIDAGGGFVCDCPQGYSGDQCQTFTRCDPDPCLNGGTCWPNPNGGYICQCRSGYGGVHCENLISCDTNPCQNGGTCQPTGGSGFRCDCLPGYSGNLCQHNVCVPNPCQNGGACQPTNVGAGYVCICLNGFGGVHCENPISCDPNPCQNGGTCTQIGVQVKCTCRIGFGGTYCQINLCYPNPCKNGGTCNQRSDGEYECVCPYGYEGEHCDKVLCDPNPCKNGGTCKLRSDGEYECVCPEDYEGKHCEDKKDDWLIKVLVIVLCVLALLIFLVILICCCLWYRQLGDRECVERVDYVDKKANLMITASTNPSTYYTCDGLYGRHA